MSTQSAPQSIERYLARAHQRWADSGRIPDPDELRAIAESVSMSEADSEFADERAHQLTVDAQSAVDDGDDERAESLLRDAVLLSPVRLQPHYLLANLYADRYGDGGDNADRQRALTLARRAQTISPTHGPTRQLIEKLGTIPQDGLSWKRAGLIVVAIVAISGSMQLCHRYFIAPDVDEEDTEEVRETLEEMGEPRH